MITYISIDTWKKRIENRFFLHFISLMVLLLILLGLLFYYLMTKEVLLTKSISVTSLESGYYQLHVDNLELAKLMNQVTLLDKGQEISYRILNVVLTDDKEKPQQVTISTVKKIGNQTEMVLIRKKLLMVLIDSIKGGTT